jgi:hypothetical protein
MEQIQDRLIDKQSKYKHIIFLIFANKKDGGDAAILRLYGLEFHSYDFSKG